MSMVCVATILAPIVVLAILAHQNRLAAEARTKAELEAAKQGLTLPEKSSMAGKVAGTLLKTGVEMALKSKFPKPPL